MDYLKSSDEEEQSSVIVANKTSTPQSYQSYLHIWNKCPTFKDQNTRGLHAQLFGLFIPLSVMVMTFYFATHNLVLSVEMGTFMLGLFLITFRHKFFLFCFPRTQQHVSPFGHLTFWMIPNADDILFMTNCHDGRTTVLKIFKITILPENVEGAMRTFISAMAINDTPFTFQIVQSPILTEGLAEGSLQTHLYLCTYLTFQGTPSKERIGEAGVIIQERGICVSNNFTANFHHARLHEMRGNDLPRALCALILKREMDSPQPSETVRKHGLRMDLPTSIVRGAVLAGMVGLSTWSMAILGASILVTLLITVGFTVTIFITWWPELRLLIVRNNLVQSEVEILDPFSHLTFYQFKRAPDTLFFKANQSFVGGIKAFQLSRIIFPPIINTQKIYDPLIKNKVLFGTTLMLNPVNYPTMLRKARKVLTDAALVTIRYSNKGPEEIDNWMRLRRGVWELFGVFTVMRLVPAIEWDEKSLSTLEHNLQRDATTLKHAFNAYYRNCKLEELQKNALLSGVFFAFLKHKFVRRNGSHLKHHLVQGDTISHMLRIPGTFLKGVEARIAAEFNSPICLENAITFGSVFNTEYMDVECPAGLLMDHARSLLITGGTIESRNLAIMRIALELIKEDMHIIAFDFTGSWSRLIRYFEGSLYAERFYHFILNRNIALDLLHSNLTHNIDNLSYFSYFVNAFRLAFRVDDKVVSDLNSRLTTKHGVIEDPSTALLDLQSQENPDQMLTSFLTRYSQEMKMGSALFHTSSHLILDPEMLMTTKKSIIVDLSAINTLPDKIFNMLVVLGKIIHYLKNSTDYVQKVIIAPRVDYIFQDYYLGHQVPPIMDLIDIFLEPFHLKGCGIISTAEQPYDMHQHAFDYFRNLITFKTTDTRDFQKLRNLMGLEELHGKGYYSKSRNESYQFRYVTAMNSDEAIMKREDVHDPFPIVFDHYQLSAHVPLSIEEVESYMQEQGFDLEDAECKLLSLAKKTLFEKDLSEVAPFIDEIKTILENLLYVDKVGGLTAEKIKEELKQLLYPKMALLKLSKKNMSTYRDRIFSLLIHHEYLVESHPTLAGGGQNIRTSYAVGPKFQQALKDEFATKGSEKSRAKIVPFDEDLESGMNSRTSIEHHERDLPLHTSNALPPPSVEISATLRGVLRDTIYRDVQWELFQAFSDMEEGRWKSFETRSRQFVSRFMEHLRENAILASLLEPDATVQDAFALLESLEGFPYTKDELRSIMEDLSTLSITSKEHYRAIYERLQVIYSNLRDLVSRLKEGSANA
jgi:hypothetical protein